MPPSPERRPVEREVKLSAGPGFDLPDLAGLGEGVSAGPGQELRMETTYYDTSDLRLARWGLSLRYRGGEGWTLKLPGAMDGEVLSRGELRFDGSSRRPPAGVAGLVRGYVRTAALEPVARLSTLRRRLTLAGPGGRQLAEVVDDEVSVLRGRRVAARFREVEVELRDGGQDLLPPLLARLRAAGAGAADPTPKHVRALGPAALEPPEVAPRALGSRPSVEAVIGNALAAATALLMRHEPLVRVGGDPEDVHQARVGIRRLRSHLRTFRPLLDRAWTDGLRAELAWLAGELGSLRDAEVLLDRLRGLATGLPPEDARPAAALTRSLAAAAEAARGRLLEAMCSERYVHLLDRLIDAAARPALASGVDAAADAAEVLPALARRPWQALREAARALGDDAADEELHRVRILAKRARYAAEAVAPAAGQNAARFAKQVANLQTVLGEHQDSANAQAWLRASAGAGRRAFVAGELYAIERRLAAEARRRWLPAWKRLGDRRLRAWMGSRSPS